jgi:hypothetical protein
MALLVNCVLYTNTQHVTIFAPVLHLTVSSISIIIDLIVCSTYMYIPMASIRCRLLYNTAKYCILPRLDPRRCFLKEMAMEAKDANDVMYVSDQR